MSPRRYLDNAATSFPKPPGVAEAVLHYLNDVGVSAGRGAYREAVESGRMLADCRAAVRRLLGCREEDDVIFALNGTDALNLVLKGALRSGDHVVTTSMDHNSTLRPLSALRRAGVAWDAVRPAAADTRLTVDEVVAALRPNTRLVAINHASNVTGAIQPVEAIAAACRRKGVLVLIDAAQSAGHVPIDFAALGADFLAMPGHKGLLGPLGTGIAILRAGAAAQLATYREGGTGSQSEVPEQPASLPDKFESGSQNAVGLAGLLAALRWIEQRGIASLREHERALCRRMVALLDGIGGLTWYGPRDDALRVGVFSVRLADLDPQEVSALLEAEAGVLSRSGLHCAPLAHETIGTARLGGTTRLSFGALTTMEDVEAAGEALMRCGVGFQPA